MQVYRARSSLVWGWLCVGLGVVLGAGGVLSPTQGSTQQGLGFGGCLAMIGIAAYLRPALAVTADAVKVTNVTRNAAMPLSRIADISVGWSLEVHGDDGLTIAAFAAPTTRSARARDRSRADEQQKPSDHGAHSPSRPATMLYDAWHEWIAAHPSSNESGLTSPSATRRWDPIGLGLILGVVVTGVVGLLG